MDDIKDIVEEIPVLGFHTGPAFPEDPAYSLELFVEDFNLELRCWEEKFGQRANFGFRYSEFGRKEMFIIDTADAKDPPPAEMLTKVGTIMADAPTQVIDGNEKRS